MNIREELPEDIGAIRALNLEAFGQPQEGRIVDALRINDGVLLSLVAVEDECVVGHILYSPVKLGSGEAGLIGAGLGPMAVLPEFQRRGIGRRLVEAGNQKMRESGIPFIVVLGHPEYYPRFGFKPAAGRGIRCDWDVPDEVFMVLVLDPLKMGRASGIANYRPEFSPAE